MSWRDLSLSEKSQVIGTMVNNGIYNLNDIRKEYDNTLGNVFKDGGKKDTSTGFKERFTSLLKNEVAKRKLHISNTAIQNMAAQLALESNYGSSRIAKTNHNYGGIGGYGHYKNFNSDEDFVKYYVGLMSSRYKSALAANTTEGYATALKNKGYYEAPLEDYTKGLKSILGSKDRNYTPNTSTLIPTSPKYSSLNMQEDNNSPTALQNFIDNYKGINLNLEELLEATNNPSENTPAPQESSLLPTGVPINNIVIPQVQSNNMTNIDMSQYQNNYINSILSDYDNYLNPKNVDTEDNIFATGGPMDEDSQAVIQDNLDSYQNTRNFYNEDYQYRIQKHHPKVTQNDVMNTFDNTKLAYWELPENIAGEYKRTSNTIAINDHYEPPFTHEFSHALNIKLAPKMSPIGGKTDANILQKAYPKLNNLLNNNEVYQERRAVNTELRKHFYDKSSGKTKQDLDTYINNLGIEDINNGFNEIGTDYTKGLNITNEEQLKAIKNAMLNVAFNPYNNNTNVYTNVTAEGGDLITRKPPINFFDNFKWDLYRTDENYYKFMENLANIKAKEWKEDPDSVYLEMLNDNTYDYRRMYNEMPTLSTVLGEGHFPDTYKTPFHPTFSDESLYASNNRWGSNIKINDIIGETEGGHWSANGRVFTLAPTQNYDRTQRYLSMADKGTTLIPNGDYNLGKYNEKDVTRAYRAAIKAGATHTQALALLGNMYTESNIADVKQIKGPAEGYLQMEDGTRRQYMKYLKDNNKKKSVESEVEFVMSLLKKKDKSLNTPYQSYLNLPESKTTPIEKLSNKYKTLKGLNTLPAYYEYDNKKAYDDWNSEDLDANTLGFLALFEKALVPNTSKRIAAARAFSKEYDRKMGNAQQAKKVK